MPRPLPLMLPTLAILLTLAGAAAAPAQTAFIERADRETSVLVLAMSVPRPVYETPLGFASPGFDVRSVAARVQAAPPPASAVQPPAQPYVDVLCGPTSPSATQRAAALVAEHAALPGPWTALWQVTGLVVRIDTEAMTMEVVDPKGGEIVRSPPVVSAEGQAALRKLKPGDEVTSLFSEHVAVASH